MVYYSLRQFLNIYVELEQNLNLKLFEINSNWSIKPSKSFGVCVMCPCRVPLIRPVPFKPIYSVRPLGQWLGAPPDRLRPLYSQLAFCGTDFQPCLNLEILTLSSKRGLHRNFRCNSGSQLASIHRSGNTQTFDLSSRKEYLGTRVFEMKGRACHLIAWGVSTSERCIQVLRGLRRAEMLFAFITRPELLLFGGNYGRICSPPPCQRWKWVVKASQRGRRMVLSDHKDISDLRS